MAKKNSDDTREFEALFTALRETPKPDEKRKKAVRAAFLTQAAEIKQNSDESFPVFMRLRDQMSVLPNRRFKMTAVITAIVVAIFGLVTGGVAYASDDAMPGDLLYGVDTLVEDTRLGLTSDSNRSIEMLHQFTLERLSEAETLAAAGDYEGMAVALQRFNELLDQIANLLESADDLDPATMQMLLATLSDTGLIDEIDDFSPDDMDDLFEELYDQLDDFDDDDLDDDDNDDMNDDDEDDMNDDDDDDVNDDDDDDDDD